MSVFYDRSIFFLIGLLLISISIATGQTKPDDLLGVWLVQKKDGKVEIFKKDGHYYGRIIWMANPNGKDGKPQLDKENPDPKKRNLHVLGMTVLNHLKWTEGEWKDGKIYDPNNGKTYSALAKMKDKNTLEFTGFIGFSFIGRTEVWTRVK